MENGLYGKLKERKVTFKGNIQSQIPDEVYSLRVAKACGNARFHPRPTWINIWEKR